MAWRRIGDKPLSELKLTQFTDTYAALGGDELIDDSVSSVFNSLRPRQNGRHFTDNIFKCIFLNENFWNSDDIQLKCVPLGLIYNISLVQNQIW